MDQRLADHLRYLAPTSPEPLGLEIVDAEGCYLWDRQGKRYLDLVAGLAVNNVGHRHPHVVKAIKEQCERFLHVIPYGEFVQEPQVGYAKALCDRLPNGLDRVYFVNSGTEAIEAALKLAKRVTGRTRLIAFQQSYHGSTHGSLSITGNENKKYRSRPLLPDVELLPFNDLNELERIDGNAACVVIEPIQGDAGVRVPDPGFLKALRARCSDTGTLLVFDEVQTGFGRTGSLFAFEHFGAIPDILVLGKALGGGLPMGAFIASFDHMEMLAHDPVLGHITTFGGHPLPCVSGRAALEILLKEDLVGQAQRMGRSFVEELKAPGIMAARRMGYWRSTSSSATAPRREKPSRNIARPP